MALTENAEMFVKAPKSKSPIFITALFALLCAVILIALMLFLGYAALILAVPVIVIFAIVSRIFYVRSLVEYEYSVMAGVLTVSKIMNQSKRKEIASVDIKEIAEFGESDKERMKNDLSVVQSELMVVDCTGVAPYADSESDKIYFFKCRDAKNGMVKVYFSPNDKILESLRLKSTEVMRVLRRIQ